jgi:hypothetical protein
MPVVKWVFNDPVTLESWTFDINPSDGGTHSYNKTFNYSNTSAPDGKVIVFQGRDQPKKMEFKGVILTEEEFDAFVEWYEKSYQIEVIDDLNRSFFIIIETFQAQRRRAVQHPWKHDYSVTATIVDWA